MTEFSNNEVAEIACIFVNLGAPEKQAEVKATERLLKQVLEARQGS